MKWEPLQRQLILCKYLKPRDRAQSIFGQEYALGRAENLLVEAVLAAVGNGVASPLLLVMRALDGIGASMLWPSVFASIGDRCAPERQARAMTVLNTTYLAGIAIGPYCAGLVNDKFGAKFTLAQPEHYNPSFYLAGGCFLLAAVFGYLVALLLCPLYLDLVYRWW